MQGRWKYPNAEKRWQLSKQLGGNLAKKYLNLKNKSFQNPPSGELKSVDISVDMG